MGRLQGSDVATESTLDFRLLASLEARNGLRTPSSNYLSSAGLAMIGVIAHSFHTQGMMALLQV